MLAERVYVVGLICHSCSGNGKNCVEVIANNPQKSGRCTLDEGEGRCFIRREPNLGTCQLLDTYGYYVMGLGECKRGKEKETKGKGGRLI